MHRGPCGSALRLPTGQWKFESRFSDRGGYGPISGILNRWQQEASHCTAPILDPNPALPQVYAVDLGNCSPVDDPAPR
jgi:hypothetical protein